MAPMTFTPCPCIHCDDGCVADGRRICQECEAADTAAMAAVRQWAAGADGQIRWIECHEDSGRRAVTPMTLRIEDEHSHGMEWQGAWPWPVPRVNEAINWPYGNGNSALVRGVVWRIERDSLIVVLLI